MPATCKICGEQNPVNAYYCGICGAPLTTEKFTVIPQSKIDSAKADLQKYKQELEQTKKSLSAAQSTISSLRRENAQLRKKKTLTQKIKAWWDNLNDDAFVIAILVIGAAIVFGSYYLNKSFENKSSQPKPIEITINYPVFKNGSVTYNGKTIASNLDTAYVNSRSRLIITKKAGKKELYEYSGHKILPQSYDDVLDLGYIERGFYGNIIPAKNDGDKGCSLFNRNTGKRISDDYFYWVKALSNNTAIIRYAKEKSSYGVIDTNGEFIVPPVMQYILMGEDSILSCRRYRPHSGEFYKIDGTLIASFPEATDCGAFSEGFAYLKKCSSNRICFIDTLGNKVTDYIYEESGYNSPSFNNGKALVRLNGVKGSIDKNFVFTPDEPK